MPEFITAVGDDSITRFDNPDRKRAKSRRRGGKKGGGERRGRGHRGPDNRKPSEGQK